MKYQKNQQSKNENHEIWKDIAGYEGLYQISTMGRIKSFVFGAGKILNPGASGYDYKKVTLCKNGEHRHVNIHALVAKSFIGNCPKNKEVRHLNGKGTDNRLSNLKYGTRSENNLDKFLHGTDNNGSRNHMAKLCEVDVLKMRGIRKTTGLSYEKIAKLFNITAMTAYRAITKQSWRYV